MRSIHEQRRQDLVLLATQVERIACGDCAKAGARGWSVTDGDTGGAARSRPNATMRLAADGLFLCFLRSSCGPRPGTCKQEAFQLGTSWHGSFVQLQETFGEKRTNSPRLAFACAWMAPTQRWVGRKRNLKFASLQDARKLDHWNACLNAPHAGAK